MSKKFEKNIQLPLQKTLTLKKDFSYTKGECTLNFTLELDSKKVRDFRECLAEALKDIDEILEQLE